MKGGLYLFFMIQTILLTLSFHFKTFQYHSVFDEDEMEQGHMSCHL